jgi:ABC-type Fe3+-hydroxamate transport system substrate-binding protein
MRLRTLSIAIAAFAALTLTGCGTTEAASDSAGSDSGSLTVTDARGTAVHLDGPAERVVGTEWNVVETLVTLGVMPVGVADVKGYGAWDTAAPLAGSGVRDIGTRGEPSVDTVAALHPDLIVATTDLSTSAIAQLEKIAPVLVTRAADASDQIQQMYDTTTMIATATGREAEATTEIAGFEDALADGKKKLAEAGLAGQKFAFSDAWATGNQVSIRPYAKGSLIGDVTERLGLVNAWPMKGDKAYGLATTDVEGLTALGDVHFLYIANSTDGGDVFTDDLAGNEVWKSLPFVVDGKVVRLPDGTWMFGGTAAMKQYVDRVVHALTA